jgi:glycosyltransferase involved in cell wall biosynthesis
MTTPPMLGVCGTILKSLRGSRHFIWEMDVFPDVLVSLGVLSERAWITRILTWVENFCHRRSDGIIVLGPCMRERLVARGIPGELVHVAENWADSGEIKPVPQRRFGPLNILYSGNLGLSHDIDTVAAALRRFRNDSRFTFTFAGGGTGKVALERICRAEGIGNVHFAPYASRCLLSEHLGQASIGLVTERPASIGTVVPSKLYGLMAAARPIVFIGPAQSTPDLLIRRFDCGWQVDPGDTESLFRLLEYLQTNREAIELSGRRARQALELHYDVSNGVARIAEVLGLHIEIPVGQRSVARLAVHR